MPGLSLPWDLAFSFPFAWNASQLFGRINHSGPLGYCFGGAKDILCMSPDLYALLYGHQASVKGKI